MAAPLGVERRAGNAETIVEAAVVSRIGKLRELLVGRVADENGKLAGRRREEEMLS